MKKFSVILLCLLLLTGCGEKKKDEFSTLGYNKDQIKVINTLKNPKQILKYKYNKNIIELIKTKDFKEENLDKYIKLDEKTELSNEDIIFIVNNNYYDENIEYSEKVLTFMKAKYFVFENLDRYLKYNNEDINTTIKEVNANLDYDYYTNIKDVDLTKGKLMLVNKYYKLSSDYVPENLVNISSEHGYGQLDKDVYEAFKVMYNDALKEGLHLYIRSPYRSYSVQNGLYERYASNDGYALADTYSARPGHSEHQTGLAFDVTSTSTDLGTFENTPEFNWMKENAHNYGFILRYPKGKEDLTGYVYESWHYRYVGKDVATQIYNEDITFEEYYAYYVK